MEHYRKGSGYPLSIVCYRRRCKKMDETIATGETIHGYISNIDI
jgi:hypothetical protein